MSDQEIQELNLSLEAAKDMQEDAAAFLRLKENKDFKRMILQKYLTEEPARLVLLKADETQQGDRAQAIIDMQIKSIGAFNNFMRGVFHKSDEATKAIINDQETLADIQLEDEDGTEAYIQ